MPRREDEQEDKLQLMRIYKKGHPNLSDPQVLHDVDKFLGLKETQRKIIRDNWEYDARQSEEPTPDLIPEKKRRQLGVIRWEVPPKPPLPEAEEISLEAQLEQALKRIAQLEKIVKEQAAVIKALE